MLKVEQLGRMSTYRNFHQLEELVEMDGCLFRKAVTCCPPWLLPGTKQRSNAEHTEDLLVLNNVEELDYISKVVEIKYNSWIGLVEREHEGHRTWVDGTDLYPSPEGHGELEPIPADIGQKVGYTLDSFWDVGQPDNWDYRENGEDCGQLHSSVSRIRKLWNDADCNLPYQYICESRA